jgi:hypothetical protein
MWDYVGIVRSDVRLRRANHRLELIWSEVEEFYRRTKVTQDLITLRNITSVAALVVRCAMLRTESRGLHFSTDHETRSDQCCDIGPCDGDTILKARKRRRKRSAPQPPSIDGKLSQHHDIPGNGNSIRR